MLHSVRARLTLWYTGILALVLITFSGISYVLLSRAIRSATDSSLIATAREFAAAFSANPNGGGIDGRVALDFRFSDRHITVLAPSGAIIIDSPSIGSAERRAITRLAQRGAVGLGTIAGGPEGDGIRFFAVPLLVVGQPYVAVVTQSLEQQSERLESAAHALFFGIPLALIVAAGGGYILARRSLSPVTAMSAKARQIGAETLEERIVVENTRDELGFLATTLNDLLERLQRAFESQRRFMADASHELRTPVSIIQGEADVALSRPERPPAEYRETIAIIQGAARNLTRIVQNLFLLARTDAGTYPVERSLFYLDELVHECVRGMRSVAAARGIEVSCEAPADLLMDADEELIRRLVLNLLDNAVKFSRAGGRVRTSVRAADGSYEISVEDSGAGIDAAIRERVFERFYRAERGARDQTDHGAGLGLPIARWIAEAHGGTLRLTASGPAGSTFTTVLPRGTTSGRG